MRRSDALAVSVVLPITLCALAACTPPAVASRVPSIDWGPCDVLVDDVTAFTDLVGGASVLDGWEDRLECGPIAVPLDQADPDTRAIELAVSRLLPEHADERARVVLTNPGGPGVEGRTFPAALAGSGLGALAEDHVLVGVDVRGTGGSTSPDCPELLDIEAPDVEVTWPVARAYSDALAAANARCVASDPELIGHLTTQDAARDLDLVRAALGVETVDVVGVSWGTELAVEYLRQFPDRVGRVLLDSVVDLRGDLAGTLDDVAAAVARSGAAPGDGNGLLLGYRPLDVVTRTAITCNGTAGADDPQQVWRDHLARAESLGLDPQDRVPHPAAADLPGTSVCAGWPLPPHPVRVAPVRTRAEIQVVVHEREATTPAAWGRHAHHVLGGHLHALPDGDHGSLLHSEAADAAVAFLADGSPMP